ncbi:type VI secretion system ImpA family N-terminal domain-containing protein [Burkholderia sp. FERM BP-3421]|nr:type VI secretion system ImpA family N-terminal domain-containing protein [Burkholderia sp. FERM BP-3421]WDD92318.1 type VI secretion system ImpA family N-terminal domain-containing protein [Burkholderia sp. FERM BP-3421]
MNDSAPVQSMQAADGLDFDEDFIRIDAAVCEYDSIGNAPQRKGESAFQWTSIEKACLGLLARAKDIRVAIWYIRACMARRGIAGLAESVRVLADIMSLPVDAIHPRALAGEVPGEIHALHLGWISGHQFLHQFGCACFGETDISLNALANGEAGAILNEPASRTSASNFLHEIQESFVRISESMRVAEQQVDVTGVLNLLNLALSRLGANGPPAANDALPIRDVEQGRGGEVYEIRGELATRKDVEAALDRIVEYFLLHEPSHPAPIFLSRVRRMLGAGFEEVMAELYPEGAALAAQLGRPAGAR